MNLTLTYHLQSPSPASHGHETLMSESSDNLNLVVLLYYRITWFCFLLKDFLKSVHIWRSYRHNDRLLHMPCFRALSCLMVQISPDNAYDGQKLLLIVDILKRE